MKIKVYIYIIGIALIPYISVSQYNYSRISISRFTEKGLSFSPNGNFFSYYAIDKPDTICSKEDICIKVINSSNFSIVNTICYPSRFLCWYSDSAYVLYNYLSKDVNEYNIHTGKHKVLFNANLDKVISENVINLNSKTIARYKNLNKEMVGFEKIGSDTARIITINKNKYLVEKYKISPRGYGNVVDYDINLLKKEVIGFFYDKSGKYVDLIRFDLKTGKVLDVMIKGFDWARVNDPKIRISDDNESLLYKTDEVTGRDSIFQYKLKHNKNTFIAEISRDDFWILDINYHKNAKYSLIYTVMGETFANKVNYEKSFIEKMLASIYLITTVK